MDTVSKCTVILFNQQDTILLYFSFEFVIITIILGSFRLPMYEKTEE